MAGDNGSGDGKGYKLGLLKGVADLTGNVEGEALAGALGISGVRDFDGNLPLGRRAIFRD